MLTNNDIEFNLNNLPPEAKKWIAHLLIIRELIIVEKV
jgi:hypothetical protein